MNKSPKSFVLKGAVCYSKTLSELSVSEEAYLVCENGLCAGVFATLPEKYAALPCRDTHGALIIPGLTDLHLHAPQYAFRATGMDLELMEWLDKYAFPQEAKYADEAYARAAYEIFADDLRKSATTRACMFATLHVPATHILMELVNDTGIRACVGKVNMDRNGSPILQEKSARDSIRDTARWIEECRDRYPNITPILTPRFVPSCSDELLEGLGTLQRTWHLPVQSHLSENRGEIAMVKQLCPDTAFYGQAYDRYGLFGGENCPTIMAHCVLCPDEELELMKRRGVYIAHCPQSNSNLSSGIAPARKYLDMGLSMGLGCDIAGGTTLSIFQAMADAIQVSKLRWRLVDESLSPLTMEEVFYLATVGGGSFFGKVGRFEPGYEFDAVIIDDRSLRHPQPMSVPQRLERLIYLCESQHIAGKYVAGNLLF